MFSQSKRFYDVPEIPNQGENPNFFSVAMRWQGSATPKVIQTVFIFLVYASAVELVHLWKPWAQFDVTPFEIFGAVLGVLIVFRTNAGYDRWWEARKVWGGIVNQCRNLAVEALNYGPKDRKWARQFLQWTAAFPYTCKASLRGERELPELRKFMTEEQLAELEASIHRPNFVATKIANLLTEARSKGQMDGFAFMQLDRERSKLIDYIGMCERILKTPMPLVYAIKVRRFLLIFLAVLPIALAPISYWLVPIVMFFVAYPLLSLDLIGMELQNPFSTKNLSHLPLDNICTTIRDNLHELLFPCAESRNAYYYSRKDSMAPIPSKSSLPVLERAESKS